MKQLLICLLLITVSSAYAKNEAELNYSGIWKDNHGLLYSVNQAAASIVMIEFSRQKIEFDQFEHGFTESTGNDLDLIVDNGQFFVLELSDGSYAFTRIGKFFISDEGGIVNINGDRLVTDQKRTIPESFSQASVYKKRNRVFPICDDAALQCGIGDEDLRQIRISSAGVISLRDEETGELVEFDRIVLASIFVKDIKPSDEYYLSVNPEAVEYSYPQQTKHSAGIQQGYLETRNSHDKPIWLGYIGNLTGQMAKLKAYTTDSKDRPYSKQIHFNTETEAIVELICSESDCKNKSTSDLVLVKVF